MIDEKLRTNIIELRKKGTPKKAIARMLGLSPNTVRKHLRPGHNYSTPRVIPQTVSQDEETILTSFQIERDRISKEYEFERDLKTQNLELAIDTLQDYIFKNCSDHIQKEIAAARHLALENFENTISEGGFLNPEEAKEAIIDYFEEALYT